METWVWLIIGLVVGIGVGAVGALMVRKNTGSQRSIADLKKENEQFREEVSGHFVETARLINRMTDSYKDVFDHLSRGAETLVDDKSLRERMPLVSGREVRLKHLGTQAGSGAESKVSSGAGKTIPDPEPTPGGSAGKASTTRTPDTPKAPDDPLKSAGTRANAEAGTSGGKDTTGSSRVREGSGSSDGGSTKPSSATRPASGPSTKSGNR